MTTTKTNLLLAFVLVFAAGAVVGFVPRVAGSHNGGGSPTTPVRPPDRTGDPRRDHGPGLKEVLKLSPEQEQQMSAIWSEHMKRREQERPQHDQKREEYRQKRDDAIRALLTPEQQAKYDAIQKEYQDRQAEINQQRMLTFKQTVEQTKKILTPEQVARYEEWLATHRPPEGGDRRGRGGPGNALGSPR